MTGVGHAGLTVARSRLAIHRHQLLVRKKSNVRRLSDLRGEPVCATRGSTRLARLEQERGSERDTVSPVYATTGYQAPELDYTGPSIASPSSTRVHWSPTCSSSAWARETSPSQHSAMSEPALRPIVIASGRPAAGR
jgi:hypothetical protein